MGSIDEPFNPLVVALGAEATFVARAIDTDRKHLTEVLARGRDHQAARPSSRSSRTATSTTTAPSTCSATTPHSTASLSSTAIRCVSAPRASEGVVATAGRHDRDRRRRGRRRGRAPRPRRAPSAAEPGIRALAADAGRGRRRPDGRLPRRRRARLRRPDDRADPGDGRAARRGRPDGAPARQRHLDDLERRPRPAGTGAIVLGAGVAPCARTPTLSGWVPPSTHAVERNREASRRGWISAVPIR